MKIYLLKEKPSVDGKKFKHYWNNNDENFFNQDAKVFIGNDDQGVPQYKEYVNGMEAYLDINFPNYEWVEIPYTRIQMQDFEHISMDIDGSTINDISDVFIKIIDGDEIPYYYYNISIDQTSAQNFEQKSYSLKLELDLWATIGNEYSSALKNTEEKFMFYKKMADRFIQSKDNLLYCDYLLQPYLSNTSQSYTLIKEPKETDITYEDWLYINSGRWNVDYREENPEIKKYNRNDWLELFFGNKDKGIKGWNEDPWFSVFNPKFGGELEGHLNSQVISTEQPPKWFNNLQSKWVMKWNSINNDTPTEKIDYFPYDWSLYNSNGIFHYAVVKTSNNLVKDKGGVIFEKDGIDVEGYNLPETTLNIKLKKDLEVSKVFHGWYNHSVSWTPGEIIFANLGSGNAKKMKNTPFTIKFNNGVVFNFIYKTWVDNIIGGGTTYPDSPVFTLFDASPVTEGGTEAHQYKLDEITIPVENGENAAYNKWYMLKKISLNEKVGNVQVYLSVISIKFDDNGSLLLRLDDTGGYLGRGGVAPHWTIYTQSYKNSILLYDENKDIWKFSREQYLSAQLYGTYHFQLKDFQMDWTITIPESYSSDFKTSIKGDVLMILPISKTISDFNIYNDLKNLNPTIYWMNNTEGLTIGDSSIVGSPINDIPFQILQAASGRYKVSDNNSLSNTLSTSIVTTKNEETKENEINKDWPYCPLTNHLLIVNNSATTVEHYWGLPCLFTDMYYIPVTIVSRNQYNVDDDNPNDILGGAYFFKTFESMFENEEIYGQNIKESDPVMYSPSYYKWVYNIDGSHNIQVDAAQIDWEQFEKDTEWEINLNTLIGDATYYKLDLGDLWNKYYPFTKTQMEMCSMDSRLGPISSENYYNWLQQNQVSYQTAKDAFKIDQTADIINAVSGGLGAGISTLIGALAAPLTGGVSLALGSAVAGASAFGSGMGIWNKQRKFDLEWKQNLENKYRAPSTTNIDGFGTGSVLFSLWDNNVSNNLSMFKTYTISEIQREQLWMEYSWKGYNFNSADTYYSFDNRKNYNYFEMDTTTKSAIINGLIKEFMSKKSLLFSQQKYINWFKDKLQGGVRLFNVVWDGATSDVESDLVTGNIEHWIDAKPKSVRSRAKNYDSPKSNVNYLVNKIKEENYERYIKLFGTKVEEVK